MGDPIPQGKVQFFGKNVVAQYKVMGHFTVSCTKTAEPIDKPFWMKTWVSPRHHGLDGGAGPNGEGVIFGPLQRSLQKGSCKRDHAIANDEDSSLLLVLVHQRIRGFAFMRYINPRLTLTLTLTSCIRRDGSLGLNMPDKLK